MIDPVTALAFSMAENKGVFAVLVGSGVSRAAGIPTGWEIILELTRRVAAAELGTPPEDPVAWYRATFKSEPNYGELLGHLTTSQDERRAILHRFIEPDADELARGLKTPTPAHRAIARLVRDGFVRIIITTNFDRLMEAALSELGVAPTVVSTEDAIKGMTPLAHTRCLVVKVHGDYLDTRIRNTDSELLAYGTPLNGLLDRIFDEHGVVACGWSGEWDVALRDAISRAPSRRYPLYWASRISPEGLAAELVERRDGRWAKIADADSFFQELQQKVEVQARLQRPHPLSLELLAATAKTYLADREQRVRLGELVVEEARRAQARIDSADISGQQTQLPDNNAEFRRRIEGFESATEPLVRVFWAMGRWGDDSEARLARDLMIEWTGFPSVSGLVIWNALRTYPAVWLWYAYGLGLVRAGRFKALHAWLSQAFSNTYDSKEVPAVHHLLLWQWDGAREGGWAHLREGFQSQDVFSDYLRLRFGEMLEREFISTTEFDRIFERFELLASFVHLEARLSDSDLAGTTELPQGTPLGRLTRRGVFGAVDAITQLARPEFVNQLLAGGFGRGSSDVLTKVLGALQRDAAQYRFR